MLDPRPLFKHAFDQIKQRIPSLNTIEQMSISILKILLIFILIYFIIGIAQWTFDKEDGIAVQPFETVGIGENVDGKPYATLLRFDLQKIKDIYERKGVISNRDGGNEIPRPLEELSMAPLADSNTNHLEYSVSKIGTVGVEATSFSLGNIILLMKELFSNHLSTVTCSIQRYNSTIIIIAILEDRHFSKKNTMAFDVVRTLDKANASINEQIPSMINDLAFQISLELSKKWTQEKEILYPQNWITFKYLTQGRDAYNRYMVTKDTNYLYKGRDMALAANRSEPGYIGTFELLSGIGYAFLNRANDAEAEKIFRNITNFKPFEGSLGLGLVYSKRGNFDKALIALDKATQLNSQYSEIAWYNKAVVLLHLGNYNESTRASDKAIDLDSQDADAWDVRGIALYRLRKYNEAIQAYDRAIEINPNDALAWYNKGNALDDLGKYDEAIKAYDKAIEINPNDALALYYKGIDLSIQGKYDEAIKAFNETIKLDPSFKEAANGRSNAQKLFNRAKEAEFSSNKAE
jgi:tetratricopeptide (TPR) repeat protein